MSTYREISVMSIYTEITTVSTYKEINVMSIFTEITTVSTYSKFGEPLLCRFWKSHNHPYCPAHCLSDSLLNIRYASLNVGILI